MNAARLVLCFALFATVLPAHAYIGPGAGITLIGSLIGLVGAVFVALWAVISWPLKKKKAEEKAAAEAAAEDEAAAADTPVEQTQASKEP